MSGGARHLWTMSSAHLHYFPSFSSQFFFFYNQVELHFPSLRFTHTTLQGQMGRVSSFTHDESPSPPPPPPHASPPPSSPTHTPWSSRILRRLLLRVVQVHQKSVQVQVIGQEVVPDRGPPHAEMVIRLRLSPLGRHLHLLQVRIHRDVDPSDGPRHHRAVLQLDRDGLVAELHEESE